MACVERGVQKMGNKISTVYINRDIKKNSYLYSVDHFNQFTKISQKLHVIFKKCF